MGPTFCGAIFLFSTTYIAFLMSYLVPFSALFVRFDRQKQALQFIGRLVARVASSKRIKELAPSSPVASFKMSFVIGITFPMADF